MKTLHVGFLISYLEALPLTPDVKYYCIGVRENIGSSLERLQEKHPKLLIERLPEVMNPRYLFCYGPEYAAKNHTLQPAYVTLPSVKEEPAPNPKEEKKSPARKKRHECLDLKKERF